MKYKDIICTYSHDNNDHKQVERAEIGDSKD